jgi:hypothetical protein
MKILNHLKSCEQSLYIILYVTVTADDVESRDSRRTVKISPICICCKARKKFEISIFYSTYITLLVRIIIADSMIVYVHIFITAKKSHLHINH